MRMASSQAAIMDMHVKSEEERFFFGRLLTTEVWKRTFVLPMCPGFKAPGRRMYIKATDFRELIQTLVQRGDIKAVTTPYSFSLLTHLPICPYISIFFTCIRVRGGSKVKRVKTACEGRMVKDE